MPLTSPPLGSLPISTFATQPLIVPLTLTSTQILGSSPLAITPQTLVTSYPYGSPPSINPSLTLSFPNVPSMFPTEAISFSTSQPHFPHNSSSLPHTRPLFPHPIFTTITTPTTTPSTPHFSFPFSSPNPKRPPKLQLAIFCGSYPLDWLFQVEQRLYLASFNMKIDALSWFKWMHQNAQFTNWGSFKRVLELCFGPSSYKNYQEELFKLRQYGFVINYQNNCERIYNQILRLPQDVILSFFLIPRNGYSTTLFHFPSHWFS